MTMPDDTPTAPVDLGPQPASSAPDAQQPPATTAASTGSPPAAPPPPPGSPPVGAPSASGPGSSIPGSSTGQPTPVPSSTGPSNQPALVFGVILVVVGAVLLVTRVTDVALGADAWPLWIIVPGLAMLTVSLAIPPRGGLGLAIPGAIVTMVGLVLWYQSTYDAYASWAYCWALVAPTAPGLGTLLYGGAKGDRELAADGLRMTLVGLALFAGFAFFFEAVLGLSGTPLANADEILPWVAIGIGALLVVLSLIGVGSGRRSARREERRAR